MSEANIIHSRYGLRCEKLDKPLNLGWGLDNSAVLHCPGELPTGWLCDALLVRLARLASAGARVVSN